MFGDTTSAASQLVISTELVTANLKQIKDAGKEAFSGFVGDIMRGTSALDALKNALQRVADRLLNLASDKILSGLFEGINGSSNPFGSFLKSAFGVGSGGSGGTDTGPIQTSDGTVWFARGGYTGAGGMYEPAGIVHRGEVVFSQADVARHGGVAAVEAMRLGLRGYASGGPVNDNRMIRAAAYGAAPAAGGAPGAVVVNMSGQPAQTERVNGPQGPRDVIVVGKTIAGSLLNDPDVQKAMAKAYGLRKVG
jgi:hypothetical protein